MPKNYFSLAAAAAYRACSQGMFWNGVLLDRLVYNLSPNIFIKRAFWFFFLSSFVKGRNLSCKLLSWKQGTNTCVVQGRKRASPVRKSKGLSPVFQIRSSLPAPSPTLTNPNANQKPSGGVCFQGGKRPQQLVAGGGGAGAGCISLFFNLWSDKHLGR